MSAEQPPGLTIFGRCGGGLRLVSDQSKRGSGFAAAKGAAAGRGIGSEG